MTENEINNGLENEMISNEQSISNETSEVTPLPKTSMKENKKFPFQLVFTICITIAVIVLYILHFITPKQEVFVPKEFSGKPGTGEVVYVNLDTINANYELVKILTGDIEKETKKTGSHFPKQRGSIQKEICAIPGKLFQRDFDSSSNRKCSNATGTRICSHNQ